MIKCFAKKLMRKSKKELQEIYRLVYGRVAYESAIDFKYKKYDYIVRLETELDVEKYL